MTARALWKPPPCTADERAVRGRWLVTTTAVSSIRRLRPSIMGAVSKADPEADEEVGSEGGEPTYLGIAFVQEILDPHDEIQPLHPVVLLEHAIGAAHVHACVAAVVDLAEGLPLLGDDVDLGEQGQAPDGLPGESDVPPVLGLARQPPSRYQIFGVRVRVVEGGNEIRQDVGLARELDARRSRRADIDGAAKGRRGNRYAAGDQVREVVVEVRQPEPDPPLPELLIHPGVPRHAALGLETGVAEVGKEEVVEGRRPKARARAPAYARTRLLDQEGERAPLGQRGAEDAVVLVAEAARQEEPVEEAKLLLEEKGRHMPGRAEDALVLAVLMAIPDPRGARAPGAHVDGVEPLDLAPLDIDLGADVRVEVDPRVRRVLEPEIVLVAREARRALPPGHRPRLGLEQHDGRLALLLGVGVDDGIDGLRPREDALHGYARVALIVAEDEGERRVEGQRDAQPPVEGIDVRAVVLELSIALEVRGGERVVEDLPGAARLDPGLERIVVARLLLHGGLKGSLALLGDDVDHAAHGVGPVQRG